MIQPLWRTVWRFLKKLKIELPYDPAILLLGIHPEKTIIQKESCTTMFIAALFTIARTWKQPKWPWTDKWIKKMWHIYTMEYYSAIKRNETELFVVRWMELESIIQSEVSQKEKNKYSMLTHIYGILKKKKKGYEEPRGSWASLVAQWLRVCLPIQGIWVRALVREDPTCCRATKPMCHNY